VSGIVKGLTSALPQITQWGSKFLDIFKKLGSSILKYWVDMFGMYKRIILAALNGLKEFLGNAFEAIKTLVINAWEKYKEIIANNIKTAKNIVSAVVSGIYNVIKTVFETLKAFITSAWEYIKTTIADKIETAKSIVTAVINGIYSVVTTVFNTIQTFIANVWDSIKTTITSNIETAKNTVSNVVSGIKNTVSSTFESVKNTVTNIWNGIKKAIQTPIENARDIVKNAIDKMKGFFNFKWELPKLKLPHFSLTGEFKINPPSVPKFSVDWYAKAMNKPMLLDSPTIFGMQNGRLLGAGEAGAEVVSGADKLMNMIQTAVNTSHKPATDTDFYTMLSAFKAALREMKVEMDSDEMGRFVEKTVADAIYT
jgi:hypothetical protein